MSGPSFYASTLGDCPECRNQRQIEVEPGIFEECVCLQTARRRVAYAVAGIEEEFWAMEWSDALGAYPDLESSFQALRAAAAALEKGRRIKRFLSVTRGSDYARLTGVSLMIRDLIRSGISAASCPFIDFIDIQFEDHGSERIREFLRAPVLWVPFEIERDHKMNNMMLERIYHQRRSRQLTVLTSRKPLASLQITYPGISAFADGRRCIEISME